MSATCNFYTCVHVEVCVDFLRDFELNFDFECDFSVFVTRHSPVCNDTKDTSRPESPTRNRLVDYGFNPDNGVRS